MLEAWVAVLSLSGIMPLEPPDTEKLAVAPKPPPNPEPPVVLLRL